MPVRSKAQSLIKSAMICLLLLIAGIELMGSAFAAEIDVGERFGQNIPHGDNDLLAAPTCGVVLNGEIRKGDLSLLDEVQRDSAGYNNVCLNSPGGSFEEALKIAYLQLPITVLPGDVCESACAIAFLGGGYFTGNGVPSWITSRSIWPGARLGFHAPSLGLDGDGSYSVQDVNNSFALSLKVSSQILELTKYTHNSPYIFMNEYLFMRFLSTPPSEMYYINMVGDALFSGIDVRGVDFSAVSDEDLALNACENAYLLGTGPQDSRPWRGRRDNLASAIDSLKFYGKLNEYVEKAPRLIEISSWSSDEVIALVGPFAGLGVGHFSDDYCLLSYRKGSLDEEVDALNPFSESPLRVRWWKHYGLELLPELADFSSDQEPGGGGFVSSGSLSALAVFNFRTQIAELPSSPLLKKWKQEQQNSPRRSKERAREFGLLKGFDIFGHDIDSVSDVSQALQCLNLCKSTDGCSASTYNRWEKVCFLKSLSGVATTTEHFAADSFVDRSVQPLISYSKAPRKVTNLKGYVVNGASTFVPAGSAESCRASCLKAEQCRAFSYGPAVDYSVAPSRMPKSTCQIYLDPTGISKNPGRKPESFLSGVVEQ